MIAILLSTYNGAKFIVAQINSILSQSETNWKLFIRDDGSKDNTKNILEDYEKSYNDKIVIIKDVVSNIGAGKSFMHLLECVEADYYMFCDQDDVWMPDKIEKSLAKVRKLEETFGKDSPIGIFTDLEVVDSNLNILMPSLWKGDNRNPEYSRNFYKQWINRHAAYGCTMMINRAAKDIVLPYQQLIGVNGGHDTWVEYNLIKNGHWDFINEPTIHYRQHGSNVIGANTGITYKDEVNSMMNHPKRLIKKIVKDYRRSKQFPFKISYPKILIYRIFQSIASLIK